MADHTARASKALRTFKIRGVARSTENGQRILRWKRITEQPPVALLAGDATPIRASVTINGNIIHKR